MNVLFISPPYIGYHSNRAEDGGFIPQINKMTLPVNKSTKSIGLKPQKSQSEL